MKNGLQLLNTIQTKYNISVQCTYQYIVICFDANL